MWQAADTEKRSKRVVEDMTYSIDPYQNVGKLKCSLRIHRKLSIIRSMQFS